MNRTTRIRITELNPHVICVLCGGYYVDATTIIECLHSFCRTCITKYMESSKYCPVCDVMVHKTKPLQNLRSDKTLQDLVYKLVPGLYKKEMKRRREFYKENPVEGMTTPSEDRGDEFYDRIIYTEDEHISLSLELCAEGIPFKTPSTIHGHTGPENIKISDVRYLTCPAAFSMGNLKRFIRMKFDLEPAYLIDIFHTDEPLQEYYTLMDIAYIYTWTRRGPLRLYYTVYDKRPRKRKREEDVATAENAIESLESVQKENVKADDTDEVPKKAQKTTEEKVEGGCVPKDVCSDTPLDLSMEKKDNTEETEKPTPEKAEKGTSSADLDIDIYNFSIEENESSATHMKYQSPRKETKIICQPKNVNSVVKTVIGEKNSGKGGESLQNGRSGSENESQQNSDTKTAKEEKLKKTKKTKVLKCLKTNEFLHTNGKPHTNGQTEGHTVVKPGPKPKSSKKVLSNGDEMNLVLSNKHPLLKGKKIKSAKAFNKFNELLSKGSPKKTDVYSGLHNENGLYTADSEIRNKMNGIESPTKCNRIFKTKNPKQDSQRLDSQSMLSSACNMQKAESNNC